MCSDQNEIKVLTGTHDEFYVVVRDEEAQKILNDAGFFGVELSNILRKQTYKRGPLDVLLSSKFGQETGPLVILDLTEAFFLFQEKKNLTISNSEFSEKQDSSTCDGTRYWWETFRDVYRNSAKRLDFAIEYFVYLHFRAQGWIVKSGFNYGTDYLLYKNDPGEEHSQYALTIIWETSESDKQYSWLSLLTFHRVVQSVNKKYLLVYVTPKTEDEQQAIDFTTPKCLDKMTLTTRLFTASSNTLK